MNDYYWLSRDGLECIRVFIEEVVNSNIVVRHASC